LKIKTRRFSSFLLFQTRGGSIDKLISYYLSLDFKKSAGSANLMTAGERMFQRLEPAAEKLRSLPNESSSSVSHITRK